MNNFEPYEIGFAVPIAVKRERDNVDPNHQTYRGYSARGKPHDDVPTHCFHSYIIDENSGS